MWFFKNNKLESQLESIDIELNTIRLNHKLLLDEYRRHMKELHDPYNKVMKQAEDVKRSKHRGRPRRDRKNDSR